MKRILALSVVFAMLIGFIPIVVTASSVTASLSTQAVHVNDVPVSITAYNIDGRNFFMLRDVAGALKDTPARFNVDWDAERGAINLMAGVMYDGAAEQQSFPATATATVSTAVVYLNGSQVNLQAYTIDGRNFYMLRDLGQAIGFEVDWDEAANAVKVSAQTGGAIPQPTEQPTEPTPTEQPTEPTPTEQPTEPAPTAQPTPTSAPVTSTGMSAADFVRSIGPGINLGNHFDAHEYNAIGFRGRGGGVYENTNVTMLETAWIGGSANAATREYFEALKNAGFTAVRIPVTWYKVATEPNNTIRADWMERVREVVSWAYELDMHIILNTHHENNHNTHATIHGIGLTDAEIEESIRIFTRWWEQIAAEFNDFGDKLIFAGLNEPRSAQREWAGGVPETRENLNRLNQVFVDTVRATGGNNANRFLIVPTHGASSTANAFDGFTIPRDSANDKIILAIHTYSPFAWAHDGEGTYGGIDTIRRDLNRVNSNAARLGVPVILSEWGSINTGSTGNLAQREQHASDYVTLARELGMATFWWDNNVSAAREHSFGLFNRRTGEIEFPTIVDAIMRAYNQ